jgi:hypothetical protein
MTGRSYRAVLEPMPCHRYWRWQAIRHDSTRAAAWSRPMTSADHTYGHAAGGVRRSLFYNEARWLAWDLLCGVSSRRADVELPGLPTAPRWTRLHWFAEARWLHARRHRVNY